ncbi:MAG: hypothetical protein HQ515_00680 [Phycisphaeraceae bacterium]|nr:hypothetical protein [Phycisphaeraceae bacterium]
MPVHDKHVLVLHGPMHHVWQEVFTTLVETGWVVHDCDSDLLLVSELGQITGSFVLCIGSVESLPAKPGRLLTWLMQHGVKCCVWATRHSAWDEIEQVQSFGVPVFTRKEAFDAWIKRLVSVLPAPIEDLPVEDHTVSDSELAALFGEHQDG